MLKKYKFHLVLLFVLLFITLISHLFRTDLEVINIALIHLLPVILVALRGDFLLTIVVTLVTLILFDLLYIPPLYSFDVHDIYYIWSFIIFILVGYIITWQAKKIHSNQIKEVLLNALSHDLKTPISSILGNTMILLDKEEIQDKEGLLEIKKSSEKINRLIANLLDSARLQGDFVKLRFDWCDLEDTLGVALQEFDSSSIDKIQIQIEPNIPLFWGDCTLISRLFVNLIDNALKYTEEREKIKISMYQQDKEIHIKFFNQSKVFSKEDLKNIFDKFYRLDNAADISGSGIGLSICKNIVDLHQGHIQASCEEDGLYFIIKLQILKRAFMIDKEL
jgi:two-component system sensor histidine kinase KdpD